MTQADFDRWWSDLTLRFPSVEGWLMRHAQDAIAQRALLRTWFGVLRDTNTADALDVNQRMQSGDLPFVENFQEERLPQHVRRLARQHAFENRATIQEPQPDYRPGSFPAGKILRRMIELADKGVPSAEAKAIALQEFPIGRSNREPRYNCPNCLDVGFVHVASNTAIQAMLADEFHACHHRDAVVLCVCRGHLPQNPKRPPRVVYSDALDFKVVDPLWREPERRRFAEWVDAQRDRRAEELAKTAANYEPAFASFNRREVAP